MEMQPLDFIGSTATHTFLFQSSVILFSVTGEGLTFLIPGLKVDKTDLKNKHMPCVSLCLCFPFYTHYFIPCAVFEINNSTLTGNNMSSIATLPQWCPGCGYTGFDL